MTLMGYNQSRYNAHKAICIRNDPDLLATNLVTMLLKHFATVGSAVVPPMLLMKIHFKLVTEIR